MSVDTLLKEIGFASKTSNEIPEKDLLSQLNRFFLAGMMSDLAPNYLRSNVTLQPIHKDSDLYLPNNIAIRSVESIQANIDALEHSLDNYTSRKIYSVTEHASRGILGLWDILFDTQRDSKYFNSGVVSKIFEGSFTARAPIVAREDQLRRLSNYWTKIEIYDQDSENILTTISFSKENTHASKYQNEFYCAIDFQKRTLLLRYNGKSLNTFRAKAMSFDSIGGALISNNCIFGARRYTNVHQDIFLESYVYPYILACTSCDVDPILFNIRNIITLGVAKNLVMIYNNASPSLLSQIASVYDDEIMRYRNIFNDQDSLVFKSRDVQRDPAISNYGYYGRRLGWASYGSGREW